MVQIHKEFSDSQVKELIERYQRKQIERTYIQEVLGIGKTRFFALLKAYRNNPDTYNTPQKLDRGIRLMLACHIKKETEYGKEYSEKS